MEVAVADAAGARRSSRSLRNAKEEERKEQQQILKAGNYRHVSVLTHHSGGPSSSSPHSQVWKVQLVKSENCPPEQTPAVPPDPAVHT